MTTILIKKKDTAGAPAPGDLTNAAGGAEIAVNTATKRIYTKDSGGTVVEVGTNPSALTTNLLFSPDATYDIGASGASRPRNLFLSGAATLGTALTVPNGGTGQTTLATGALGYGQGTSAHASLSIGTAGQVLTVNSGATAPQWSTLSGVAVTTFSAGTTGFTPSSATSGAVTLAGTLATTNGGTGLTSFTSGGVVYASSSSVLATGSALTFDGTNLILGAANPLFQGSSSTGSAAISNNSAGAYIRLYGSAHATRANYTDFINGSSTSTFDSAGNLGIGRTPTAAGTYRILELDGATGGYVRLYAAGTQSGYWYSSAVESGIGSKTSAPFLFYTNDAERGRFSTAGNFSVGATGSVATISAYSAGKGTLGGIDTSASAAGVGATLDLGGNYRTTGDYQPFVRIAAEKTNATNGDYGYNMGFYVTSYPNSTFGVKAITITSTGIVSINPVGGGSGNKLAIYGGGTGQLGALQISDGDINTATNYWNIGRDNSLTGEFTFALNTNIFWRMTTSGEWKRTLTGDLNAIRIYGSYTGTPELVAIGQSSSDGFMQIWDASRATSTRLQGYASGVSYFAGSNGFGGTTTSASYPISVSQGVPTGSGGNARIKIGNHIIQGTANDDLFFYGYNGNTTGALMYAGGYYTFSARSIKSNIQKLQGALADVMKLNGYTYDITATGRPSIGTMADEVAAVYPDLVTFEKDDPTKEAIAVDYASLCAVLIEAVKELKNEFDAYKASHA